MAGGEDSKMYDVIQIRKSFQREAKFFIHLKKRLQRQTFNLFVITCTNDESCTKRPGKVKVLRNEMWLMLN